MKISKITKVVIPVAGLGTRMLPATKEVPKELLPILDKPIIQYSVEEAISSGITDIVFVTRPGKNTVKNHFSRNRELENFLISKNKKDLLKKFPDKIFSKINFFSVEQKLPLGLGNAILSAQKIIQDDPFAVFLPDELLVSKKSKLDFQRMIKNFSSFGKPQILVEEVQKKLIPNYGIVKLCKKKISIKIPLDIIDIVEKPSIQKAPSNNRVVGRYIMPNDLFKYLKKTEPGKDNEIQLTDAIKSYLQTNKSSFQATLSNSHIYDCGSIEGLVGANIALGLKDKKIKKFIKEIIS